ncbi:MAG: ATP-binding cassette domain-containing protein [Bacteroidales bacterium]|nr:ATP-binding cassette domain-containing protein [Bacteroidales bacterium]
MKDSLLYGENASGKSRMAARTVMRHPTDHYLITFRDSYGTLDENYYYQLRWNAQAIDEDTPTLGQLIDKADALADSRASWDGEAVQRERRIKRKALLDKLLPLFGLDTLLDKYIISLSSGELRKFCLVKALLSLPRVLILDAPFTGLDAGTRAQLVSLLEELASHPEREIRLLMPRLDLVPSFIGKVETLPHGPLPEPDTAALRRALAALPAKDLSTEAFYPRGPHPEIVRCNGVSIRYGTRTILDQLDWVVHEGECWAIGGANGAGKSTLLSLVCADNPQAYACDISLFSHRRGSGESIWEIKHHIGYVSPELHRAWQHNIPALEIVASGLYDTTGLPRRPDAAEEGTCRFWMRLLGIESLADRSFLQLSDGEQRLCLIARAFVKDPELLVLDEPLHGLDEKRSELVKALIECFMQRPHKTLLMVTHFEHELPGCIDHRLDLQKRF